MLVPDFLELLFGHEGLVLFYTRIDYEHGRVSISVLEVDFAHIPLKVLLVELGKIFRKYLHKLSAYFLQLAEVVVAVKLKGTVHNSTVVEGGHR